MKTNTDLKIEFWKETGIQFDSHKQEYYDWVEEKYLEKLNEEEFINQIFVDDNTSD